MNKFSFNCNEIQNKEFGDGGGLELMDFNARMYNAQIGKFFAVDKLAELNTSLSPYQFTGNNPVVMLIHRG
jgi:RHS repeat-associated protein